MQWKDKSAFPAQDDWISSLRALPEPPGIRRRHIRFPCWYRIGTSYYCGAGKEHPFCWYALPFRIYSSDSIGSKGSLMLLQKSLPEPVGMYPKTTRSKSVMPVSTSWMVPSPPTAMIYTGSDSVPRAQASEAISAACPEYLVRQYWKSIPRSISCWWISFQMERPLPERELGLTIK